MNDEIMTKENCNSIMLREAEAQIRKEFDEELFRLIAIDKTLIDANPRKLDCSFTLEDLKLTKNCGVPSSFPCKGCEHYIRSSMIFFWKRRCSLYDAGVAAITEEIDKEILSEIERKVGEVIT